MEFFFENVQEQLQIQVSRLNRISLYWHKIKHHYFGEIFIEFHSEFGLTWGEHCLWPIARIFRPSCGFFRVRSRILGIFDGFSKMQENFPVLQTHQLRKNSLKTHFLTGLAAVNTNQAYLGPRYIVCPFPDVRKILLLHFRPNRYYDWAENFTQLWNCLKNFLTSCFTWTTLNVRGADASKMCNIK